MFVMPDTPVRLKHGSIMTIPSVIDNWQHKMGQCSKQLAWYNAGTLYDEQELTIATREHIEVR